MVIIFTFVILTPVEDKPEILKEKYSVDIVSAIDEDTLSQIKELDDSVMPEKMRYNIEDLRDCFNFENGVKILVRDEDKNIRGYLIALPKSEEYEDLHEKDPELLPDDKSLYLESIVIKDGDLKTLIKVLATLREEAENRGYKNLSMHARVSEGLSNVLQKRYGAKFFRRIENWFDFGEPFDYLEIDLDG